MPAFWGLLAFLTLSTAVLAAGVARGHVTIRRRPAPAKPKEKTSA